jgi:hypothetical protein
MATKRVITGEMTLSYPALFEPKNNLGGEPKYGCALIGDKSQIGDFERAAYAAAEEKWGAKARGMIAKKQLRWPLRDGAEKEGVPGYGAAVFFVNVSSKMPPAIVDRYAGPDGKPRPITNAREIYPGTKVRALLGCFTYDVNGNRGISFGIDALQKLADGPRIDGRLNPEDAFDVLEGPTDFESGAGDLDDLLG